MTTTPVAHRYTEAQLEAVFRKRVRQVLGGIIEKLPPPPAGRPDRLVLLPCNRIRLVELKTETGRLSPIQEEWHRRAANLGIRVDVLYGLDQIDAWVRDRAQEYDHLMELL